MGVRISALTQDGAATATDIIPISKAGTPRAITVAEISTFIIDNIEAIAAAAGVDGADSVFILDNTDGLLKPTDIDNIAQHGIDTMWGKVAETTADDADLILLKDGGATEKTLTLTLLATYILAEIEAAILDVSDLDDGSGAIATTDHLLVTQGTTGKRVTVQDIEDLIYTGLAAHVQASTLIASVAGTDVVYTTRAGAPFRATFDQIATFVAAAASVNGSGTTDTIAQWVDADTLKAGPTLVLGATGFGAGSDTSIPTTSAVRKELDEIVNDQADIGGALLATDTILVDDGANGTPRKSELSRVTTLVGASLTNIAITALDIDGGTDIGANLVDADLVIVDDGAGGTNRKSALSRVNTYIQAKIDALTSIATWAAVLDEDNMVSDSATKLATQQSIKAYVDTEVAGGGGAAYDGDINDLDIDGGTDIGANLADADLIIVDDGAGGTNRKSALSRVNTYIQAKIDALTSIATWNTVLDEDNMVSDSATKLVTQQSIKAYVDSGAVAYDGDIGDLTIQLGTDIGAPLVDADLIIVDDGAGGTTRKSAMSRVNTYIQAKIDAITTIAGWASVLDEDNMVSDSATVLATQQSIKAYVDTEVAGGTAYDGDIGDLDIDGGTDIGAAIDAADLLILDDGAGGTNRKSTFTRVKTFVETVGTIRQIYIDAGAMIPSTTSPAQAKTNEYVTNDVDLQLLAFDGGATEERATFKLVMPPQWDGGTIKAKFYWSSDTGSSVGDTVEWSLSATADRNTVFIDGSQGTVQVVSDAILSSDGKDYQLSAETPAITVGGGFVLDDILTFVVSRNTDGADDMVEDAWLFGIMIQFTESLEAVAW